MLKHVREYIYPQSPALQKLPIRNTAACAGWSCIDSDPNLTNSFVTFQLISLCAALSCVVTRDMRRFRKWLLSAPANLVGIWVQGLDPRLRRSFGSRVLVVFQEKLPTSTTHFCRSNHRMVERSEYSDRPTHHGSNRFHCRVNSSIVRSVCAPHSPPTHTPNALSVPNVGTLVVTQPPRPPRSV